jgi:hypothetical protein
MRTPTQQTRAQAHRGVALFIATLTILIALVALAPLNGIGQPFGQSPRAGNRLPAKGSVSAASPLFLSVVAYDSGGGGARSVAVADVNGDGKPDLVVANNCASGGDCTKGTVGVLLGNGNGTFRPTVNYSSGGNDLPSVAVADVNGDGKPDLVVSNR